MDDDVPRKCAARGETTFRARFLSAVVPALALGATLSLGGFPRLPAERALETPRPEDTVPGSAAPTAPGALAALDPRGGGARLVEALPAPTGRWVALRAESERPHRVALWIVDLETGGFRPFEPGAPTGAPLVWREGSLWTEVLAHQGSRARRQLVSIDPATLGFEPLARTTVLAPRWAHAVITRRAGGRRVLTLEWSGTGRELELPGGPESDYRVSETPGVVFSSEREHDGALRVLRHDLATGLADEVVTVGGLAPHWSPSPDGLLVAVSDDHRLRLLDARDGTVVSGPWPAGRPEWLPGGHGHLLLTSDGHHYVLEVYAGRRVHLGEVEPGAPKPVVHRLAGGGYLVRRGGSLERLDDEGRLMSRLIER